MTPASIGNPQYIALETFKKNGEAVNTPVWVVAEDGKLFVWTGASSWKVKRIRNNPRVRLAPSDARGNPQGGWVEGTARIHEDAAAIAAMQRRLTNKYGLMYRLFSLMGRLRGRQESGVVLEIA